MEKFKEALQNCDTVKVILTGVGEKQFETKEIFESLLELEKLAEIGKALERATKIGTAWVFVESIGECTYPSEEEIQSLVLWYRECNKEFYAI